MFNVIRPKKYHNDLFQCHFLQIIVNVIKRQIKVFLSLQALPVSSETFRWRNWPDPIMNGWRWLIRSSEAPEQFSSAPQTTLLRWQAAVIDPRPRGTTRVRERLRGEGVSGLGSNPERPRQVTSEDWMREDSVTAQISWITRIWYYHILSLF